MSKTFGPLTIVPDPEELVGCPYNESHRTSRMKLQFHLVKCRKANPNAKKVVCPFNGTHMINEQEYGHHLEECPDRGNLDSFKYVTPSAAPVVQPLPEPYLPPSEENWDDVCCGTYEPAKKMAESPLINSHALVTKSEKKKIKHRERNKFRQLEGGCLSRSPEPPHQDSPIDQPLRAPKSTSVALHNTSPISTPINQIFSEKPKQLDPSSKRSENSDKISRDFVNLTLVTEPKQFSDNSEDFVVVKHKGRKKRN